MGKRSSRRKNASMLDSDDDDTASSSSTAVSDATVSVWETEDLHGKVQGSGTKLLDCVDALFEKRGSTREKALSAIVDAFINNLQYEFVDKNCVTLLHRCLNSIKKGSSKEISLASRAIGLLALTVGCGNNAAEILEHSIPPLSQTLKSGSESTMSSVLDCLAVVTFVGGNDPDVTEKSMQIMWQIIHPKSGLNVSASKTVPAVLTAAISAWSFLLTTVNECNINSKSWQESISYFSNLLDKEDRSIRIAAGEAIALIFEMGQLDKLCGEDRRYSDSSVHEAEDRYAYIQGLKGKILSQVRNLSVEASHKGLTKKDLGSQRNLFRDVVEFLEDGYCPETSIKIGGDTLNTTTWSHLIQLNFLKRFLGGGFPKHMQENELLHQVFEFIPKKQDSGSKQFLTSGEKRLFKSPNSIVNKARTQLLNKQRMLSQDRNAGHFAVGDCLVGDFFDFNRKQDGVPLSGYACVPAATQDLWNRLFSAGYKADVSILTDNCGVINAHASILGMASPVMKSMLKHSRGRGRRRSITIQGVPHQAVQVFIRFLYSSCYEQEEMNKYGLHLLVLSHAFVVPHLKKECERRLELTTENVVDIFQLSLMCDAPRLSLFCHRLILKSFKIVSATEGWRVMKQSHPRLEKELLESVVEANSRKQERAKKIQEKKIYLQLYDAMEALLHICKDGCRTIGPHDKDLKGDQAPCSFAACKGLELLIRHFARCKMRVPGGCVHCKRMWQLLELHSRLCAEPDNCRVPLCRNFKERLQQQNKKDSMRWEILAKKIVSAKNMAGARLFSLANAVCA
ncbi:hypothetical protein NE237_017236 [Protea cynaroides]|uniref:BTB/POZ and TAZ domain-containing protein 4 n=1 Tax=Protea cynaroides TaxID=273540 RepID=A0A9Q0K7N3_9MAGN|nr:hypothetical protein NE237_017236 [Protea cynaroides]